MRRENNLDLLRVIACIMVISIHVSAFYVSEYKEILDFRFTVGNFYDSFSRIAVPLFVLLSGRFALSDEKNIEIKKYYKKFFRRIIIPTFVWSLLYFLFNYMLEAVYFLIYKEFKHDLFSPVKTWIMGAPFYHLWYLYMSLGLYLLVPYLLKLKNKIGEKNFFKFGILFFIFGLLLSLFETFLTYINFYDREDIFKYLKYFWYFNQFKFINYLGYFILGYSLKNYKNKYFNFKNMLGLSILSLSLIFIFTEYFVRKYHITDLYFYNNNFIFVMFASITFYLAFDNLEQDKIRFDFSKLAIHSFNIYLVHAGILLIIYKIIEILKYELNPIWFIPLMIFLIFELSYIFSIILENLKLKFLK